MRTDHGLYKDANGKKSRLYHIWEDMKSRCLNTRNRRYSAYGGRGITVCAEWKNNYRAFHDWSMANGYVDNLTIERNDVNGNYEPSNCSWATQKDQGNNRRTNRMIEFNGISQSLANWADALKIPYHVLKNRLMRGWTIERAMTQPLEKHNKRAA